VDLGTARARAALAATERTLTAVERVNAALLAAGQAYPAFFATLRGHLADVSRAARAAGDPAGLWRRSGRRPQRRRHHGGPRRPAAAGRLAQTVRRIVPYLAAGFPDFDGCDAWRRADPVNRDDPCPCSTGSNEATCTTSSAPTVTASSSPPGPNSCEVVVTAPGLEWLATFTRQLVDDHLAASGHNIVPIRSIYLWHGTVYDRTEARVALHTRTSLVSRIVDRANAKHPHDIPCVIALPIVSGNPSYVRWILDETTES
jgi:periplasmic divalent cation tolerance protein